MEKKRVQASDLRCITPAELDRFFEAKGMAIIYLTGLSKKSMIQSHQADDHHAYRIQQPEAT